MKRAWVGVAVLMLAVGATAQVKPTAPKKAEAPPVEAKVRKLWEAYKAKDKATLSSLIDDQFRQFEEGLTAFADKKSEVNSVDEFDLISYTLSDFNIKPLGPKSVLVTYIAQYEGKSGSENSKAKSVFGEVWTLSGNDWKCSYMQETYVK
jgi:hypothetical protein